MTRRRPPSKPVVPAAPTSAADTRPGLVKARPLQVVTRHSRELVAIRDGWWSAMLERADVVSEGGSVAEAGSSVYYGSTSLRCLLQSPAVGDRVHAYDDPEQLLDALLSDAHARLRILRVAHREAVVRAGAPINVLHAEIGGRVIREGERVLLAIDVDVNADEMAVNRDAM